MAKEHLLGILAALVMALVVARGVSFAQTATPEPTATPEVTMTPTAEPTVTVEPAPTPTPTTPSGAPSTGGGYLSL